LESHSYSASESKSKDRKLMFFNSESEAGICLTKAITRTSVLADSKRNSSRPTSPVPPTTTTFILSSPSAEAEKTKNLASHSKVFDE
jgi:hypothetical protein